MSRYSCIARVQNRCDEVTSLPSPSACAERASIDFVCGKTCCHRQIFRRERERRQKSPGGLGIAEERFRHRVPHHVIVVLSDGLRDRGPDQIAYCLSRTTFVTRSGVFRRGNYH